MIHQFSKSKTCSSKSGCTSIDPLPMFPLLNGSTFALDIGSTTISDETQAVRVHRTGQKKIKIRLQPRKQITRPKREFISSPKCPSELVDEGLELQVTPTNFYLPNENRFSTPKALHSIVTMNTSILCPFPVLPSSATPDQMSRGAPFVSLKPRFYPKLSARGRVYSLEQRIVQDEMNTSTSSTEGVVLANALISAPMTPRT